MKIEQTDEYSKGWNDGVNREASRRAHEYEAGYQRGFHEGYYKAMENIPETIRLMRQPYIIVTTKENIERLTK
jgi:hypothetical protein